MNKIKWIGLIIVIVLIGWLVSARRQTPVQEVGTSPIVASQEPTDASTTTPTTDITKPVGATTYTYDGVDGKTALDLLKAKYQNIETQSSSVGDFVTAIDGKKADPAKEYWAFYLNGSLASEGAGTYVTKTTDKIEWRLELL